MNKFLKLLIQLSFAIILVFFININIFSQVLNHSINPNPESFNSIAKFSSDTIQVLAVMVEFVADKDASTYGTGKFGTHYSKNYGNEIIDPLPHNKNYFENQLTGLSNYFKDCSNGKVIIQWTLLDKTIQLDEVMSKYSPPPKSEDYSNAGKLFQHVWKKVDSMYIDTDFSKYKSFIIFHAGVGRDISLTENFNFDMDIPSLYLNLKSLKKYIGNDYVGFPVGKSKTLITNSMIIPETESREVSTFTGQALIEIGIRGLLVSSFASFLGLPDLYNTLTGLSEIGRFGLMDGQAIFSYGGVIPPEPSAWEKIYLGWVKPEVINTDMSNVSVVTRFANQLKSGTILKVPINPFEYFLIENRQRDALKNGAIVKYVLDSITLEKKFEKDTTGFYYFNIDSLQGVIVGIDEHDWALPGNGILIWHIDEKIIAQKISDNKINADHKNRGVFLEEADGIQDIGVKFTTILGDEVVGDGEPNDMWFKENDSKLFKNEFSDVTLPNTKSNSGAPSYLSINGFTNNSNSMNVNIVFGNNNIKPLCSVRISQSAKNSFVFPNLLTTQKLLYVNNGTLSYYNFMPIHFVNLSDKVVQAPAYCEINGVRYFIFIETNSVQIYSIINDEYKIYKTYSAGNDVEYSTLMIADESGSKYLYCGATNGKVYKFNLNNFTTPETLTIDTNPIIAIASKNGNNYYLSSKNLIINNNKIPLSLSNPKKLGYAYDTVQSRSFFAVQYKSNNIETYDLNGNKQSFLIGEIADSNDINYSIGNINGDGNNYIVVNRGSKLYAYNRLGFLASGFPIGSPNKVNFKPNNYLVDIDSDNIPEIFIETEDGQLLCYSGKSAKLIEDFRVSLGSGSNGSSLFINVEGKLQYHTLSDSGYYQIIQISDKEKAIHWNGIFGDYYFSNSSYQILKNNQKTDFLSKSQVYNWPNPVYDKVTHIRYLVSEDSKISIKIYDLSGAFVTELNNNALGGIESETKWDVTNIQNGIYLARVEAISPNKSDFAIIKIAVVK